VGTSAVPAHSLLQAWAPSARGNHLLVPLAWFLPLVPIDIVVFASTEQPGVWLSEGSVGGRDSVSQEPPSAQDTALRPAVLRHHGRHQLRVT
jgi:hypothetical protein